MPLVKAYVAPNFLRKQTYKQTTKLPAGANATYEISVVSYTFIKKWSEATLLSKSGARYTSKGLPQKDEVFLWEEEQQRCKVGGYQ